MPEVHSLHDKERDYDIVVFDNTQEGFQTQWQKEREADN